MPEVGSASRGDRAEESCIGALDQQDDGLVETSLDDLRCRPRRSVVPTATRTADVLPLTTVDPEAFERLIAEVVAAQDNHSVHFYGRRGQAQYGLDIVEERRDGVRVLYQVKRFEQMTAGALRDAVATYAGAAGGQDKPPADRRFRPASFIVVTSAKVEDDTALVDCISDLQDKYRGDLKIDAWGAETVSRKLRRHRALVAAVFSEAWADTWCSTEQVRSAEKREKRKLYVDEVLRAAMSVRFGKDNDVRFRQVDLTGVSVESLFVDVPASSTPASSTDRLLNEINPYQQAGSGDISVGRAGAAQALLHPLWTDSTVIVGGPGQGKTTLLQFLCQYHRARCLGRDEYSPIAAGLAPVTRVGRTPIKVELPEYAAWRRARLERNSELHDPGSHQEPDTALLTYIADSVARDSGRPFNTEDLALAIATRPMIIALDGLDEIASTNERTTIADEVRTTNSRIQAVTRSVMVLVATRPGNVGNPIWRDINFSTLFLGELTPALRMKYLERWTAQSKLTADEIADLRTTFAESIGYPHVVELAGNPMQLAILLNLMQRRTVLPEKRTALYDRYIEVFMDRESKSSIVAANKDVIVSFHKLLGWYIHSRVEIGKSSGTIGLEELRRLLVDYLTPRGYSTSVVGDLFDSVTTRVLCLVQRELDSHEFQFEVQPLREYFAAEHLYDVSPNQTAKNNRQACLAELIRRPYWANVMRFFAGKFSSGEVPAIPYALRALQNDKALYQHPITRTAAKHLLDDRVLSSQLELVVTDVVRVLFDGPGLMFAVDGLFQQDESLIRFQERGGLKQAIEVLLDRLGTETNPIVRDGVVKALIHIGAGRLARDTWWRQTAIEPDVWIHVAATLGALDNLDAVQRHTLDSITPKIAPSGDVLRTLVDTGARLVDDDLTSVCLTEIGSGIDNFNTADVNTPFRRLAAATSVHHYYEHRTTAESASQQELAAKRHRGRVRSPSPIWNAAVQGLERSHERPGWQMAKPWHDSLDIRAEVFSGDCWTVREAILALPETALSTPAAIPRLDHGTVWRNVALWRAIAIGHRSDPEWFTTEAAACDDPLSRMSFILYALTAIKPSALPQTLGAIDEVLKQLDQRQWATIANALYRYAHASVAPSEANLTEALRLQQIAPSPKLAVLLWHLCNEGTKIRLGRHIASGLNSLWNSGFGVSSVLLHFLRTWDKRLPAEQFIGSRWSLPAGTLQPTDITQMTYSLAESILRCPHDWPTDLVRAAVDRLSSRLANQKPLAEVAHSDAWGT